MSAARISQLRITLARAQDEGHGTLVAEYENAARRVEGFLDTNRNSTDAPTVMFPERPASDSDRFRAAVADLVATRARLEHEVGPIAPVASASQVFELASITQSDVVYVLATPLGGMSLRVSSHSDAAPRLAVRWLPNLTDSAISAWSEKLYLSRSENDRTVSIEAQSTRGMAPAPSPSDILGIVTAVNAALGPAADEGPSYPVRLVPLGTLSSIPLPAAWPDSVPVSVAASAQLHYAAHQQWITAPKPSGIIAVTDPRPCTWYGHNTAELPEARAEGSHLAQRYGAAHYTAAEASLRMLRAGLVDRECLVLHIGAHGATTELDPDRPYLLLRNGPDGRAEVLTVDDLLYDTPTCRLVFLACCWLARSSRRLPDEAIGFPTFLMQAGVGAVIAPLWPVGDRPTRELVEHFYYRLIAMNEPPDHALLAARNYLIGQAGSLPRTTADVWRATAHAFVLTGA